MIVKIQRPVVTNEPVPLALFYNEDRSLFTQQPFENVEPLFKEGELKIYVEAEVVGTLLMIDHRVEDQDW